MVSVWPTLGGYCLHLDETRVFYDLRHAEVLGDLFNPRIILNQMRAARLTPRKDRPSIFKGTALNMRQSIMLHAVKLMVGVSRAHENTKQPEGVLPVGRTSMEDQLQQVPKPVIVLAKINGHQTRAPLDTGSMADFLSTTPPNRHPFNLRYMDPA